MNAEEIIAAAKRLQPCGFTMIQFESPIEFDPTSANFSIVPPRTVLCKYRVTSDKILSLQPQGEAGGSDHAFIIAGRVGRDYPGIRGNPIVQITDLPAEEIEYIAAAITAIQGTIREFPAWIRFRERVERLPICDWTPIEFRSRVEFAVGDNGSRFGAMRTVRAHYCKTDGWKFHLAVEGARHIFEIGVRAGVHRVYPNGGAGFRFDNLPADELEYIDAALEAAVEDARLTDATLQGCGMR